MTLRKRRDNARDLALAYLAAESVLDVRLERVLSNHIGRVLQASDYNLSLAAELLGMHRRTLQRTLNRPTARRRRRRRSSR